jgi:hypothetical protein
MVEDGELPSVVLRQGNRQRMVRIPAGFVTAMLRDLGAGTQVSLKEYTTRWLASAALQSSAAGDPLGSSTAGRPS